MENINSKFATNRLETLKQCTILDDCCNINFDNNYDLYNSMIKLFADGNFDAVFNSSAFNDLNTDERRMLLENGRKYLYLCFGQGGIDNWPEYASSKYGGDFDLCFINVLKNFDILLTILRYGKEDSMNLLSSLNESRENKDYSIIDELRMFFPKNDILIQSMIEMGQSTNAFSLYPDSYKRLLCEFSDGLLYEKRDDNEFVLKSPLSVSLCINKKINGDADIDTFSYDEYKKAISDNEQFTDAIMGIYYDNKSSSFDDIVMRNSI